MNKKTNWGGKRKNAGRPILGDKKVVESTKVARIDIKHYARIKSNKYDDLMQILWEYRSDIEENKKSKTSPRYQKLIQLMIEIEELFGSDFDSWV